jgi:hypothetical protein
MDRPEAYNISLGKLSNSARVPSSILHLCPHCFGGSIDLLAFQFLEVVTIITHDEDGGEAKSLLASPQ